MKEPAKVYAWHSALTSRGLGDGQREFVHVHCRHAVKVTAKRLFIVARCPHRGGIMWQEKRKHIVGPIDAVAVHWWKLGGEVWYVGTEAPHAIDGKTDGVSGGVIPKIGGRALFGRDPDAEWRGFAVSPCLTELGLDGTATAEDVKRAFRREALRAHPDRGGSAAAFVKLTATYREALRSVVATALA